MDYQSPTSAEATTVKEAPRWTRRVGWLLLIWLVSVIALGIVALVFRLLMSGVGLTR